jgi:hypothetical protein
MSENLLVYKGFLGKAARVVIQSLSNVLRYDLTNTIFFDRLGLPTTKGHPMSPTIEFSDGFDAVGWYYERMSRADYDEYYEEG